MKNGNGKMVFKKAKETPRSQSNKSPRGGTNDVKKVLPTRDGIYVPATSPGPKKTASKSSGKWKPKPQSKKPVQFKDHKSAVKHMKKSVKAKQKRGPGGSARRGFNK